VVLTLTPTLAAALRRDAREPHLTVVVSDQLAETPRWEWAQLYADGPDGAHALVEMASGPLVRARRGPLGELFVQRIADPAEPARWSTWSQLRPAGTVFATAGIALAASTVEDRLRLFWVRAADARTIRCAESTDGQTWVEEAVHVEAAPGQVVALAADMAGGDNHLFYGFDAAAGGADTFLVALERGAGGWGSRTVLGGGRHPLRGLAAAKEVATGTVHVAVADAEGAAGLERRISVVAFAAASNAWGAGYTLVKHGASSGYDFRCPRLRLASAAFPRHLFTWVESRAAGAGGPAYERPMLCVTPRQDWLTEWVPWDVESPHGFELLRARGGRWYLVYANRAYASDGYAGGAGQRIDVSADVVDLQIDAPGLHRATTGRLVLRDVGGRYADAGVAGPARCLRQGSQVAIRLGFRTAAGVEGLWQEPFWVDTVYHALDGREASIELHFSDAWAALERLRPALTVQFPSPTTVGDVLDRALWRVTGAATAGPAGLAAGLSNAVWQPGRAYADAARRLCQVGRLVLRFRTAQAEVDGSGLGSVVTSAIEAGPRPAEYTYGAGHAILAARIGRGGQAVNHVTAQGSRAGPYLAEAHDHAAIRRVWRRVTAALVELRLSSQADTQAGADGALHDARRLDAAGWIEVPLNPAQELGDTIAIDDPRLGMRGDLFVVGGKHVRWSRAPRQRADMRLLLIGA
jgi:hypothetical protein